MKNKNFNEIFNFETLFCAMKNCAKGVIWKEKVQNYIKNYAKNLSQLLYSLQNETYKIDPVFDFVLSEKGKKRHITPYDIKDRIVQRCLCDEYLVPLLSKSLIYDCPATRKNMGLEFSKNRVCKFISDYYQNHQTEGYVLSIDIHHYFECIDHNILKQKLKPKIKDVKVWNLLCKMIDFNKKGLGLGSQISQICALFYLSDLDHFIKEKLGIKYYERYMDDLILIHSDKEYLKNCLTIIKNKLNQLGLQINNSKTKIKKLSKGFLFCKTYYQTNNQHKIQKIITTTPYKDLIYKINKGEELNSFIHSWFDYLSKFSSYKYFQKFKKDNFKIFKLIKSSGIKLTKKEKWLLFGKNKK